MTEARKKWIEQWGFISLIIAMLAQVVVISMWAGKIETKTDRNCTQIEEVEKSLKEVPEKYSTKAETAARWEAHMKRESEERAELRGWFDKIDTKIEGLYKIRIGGPSR